MSRNPFTSGNQYERRAYLSTYGELACPGLDAFASDGWPTADGTAPPLLGKRRPRSCHRCGGSLTKYWGTCLGCLDSLAVQAGAERELFGEAVA